MINQWLLFYQRILLKSKDVNQMLLLSIKSNPTMCVGYGGVIVLFCHITTDELRVLCRKVQDSQCQRHEWRTQHKPAEMARG